MRTNKYVQKMMVDLILYNRLGENPTHEEISNLLDKYKLEREKIEDSLQQNELLVNRLTKALDGGALYADWHKKFRNEVHEISLQKVLVEES